MTDFNPHNNPNDEACKRLIVCEQLHDKIAAALIMIANRPEFNRILISLPVNNAMDIVEALRWDNTQTAQVKIKKWTKPNKSKLKKTARLKKARKVKPESLRKSIER